MRELKTDEIEQVNGALLGLVVKVVKAVRKHPASTGGGAGVGYAAGYDAATPDE